MRVQPRRSQRRGRPIENLVGRRGQRRAELVRLVPEKKCQEQQPRTGDQACEIVGTSARCPRCRKELVVSPLPLCR